MASAHSCLHKKLPRQSTLSREKDLHQFAVIPIEPGPTPFFLPSQTLCQPRHCVAELACLESPLFCPTLKLKIRVEPHALRYADSVCRSDGYSPGPRQDINGIMNLFIWKPQVTLQYPKYLMEMLITRVKSQPYGLFLLLVDFWTHLPNV